MPKTKIIQRLGDSAVLLPSLIGQALRANDRLKLRLTLLQEAEARAGDPGRPVNPLTAERRGSGLDDPRLDELVSGASRAAATGRLHAPGLAALVQGLGEDLELMFAPIEAVHPPGYEALAARVSEIAGRLPPAEGDELAPEQVSALTQARREGADSLHLLVMDLHRQVNALAADASAETIDGAKALHLDAAAKTRLRAFMKGLNRTAPLAFGHPGLGATAVQVGDRLTIQNDIGETEAHVLVIHVDGCELSITYTDVHRRRTRFFISLFGDRLSWTPLAEQTSDGLGEDGLFYLVTGRGTAENDGALDELLEFLGSRLVFLIDWNKARKTLQAFVSRDAAIGLLTWAASQDLGHRAFLELGGAEVVLEAIRAAGRTPYGVRLDAAMGEEETIQFLRWVLKETSEGLKEGRSARLIRDEIQADLAQRFESAEAGLMAVVVRHLGLSHTLAGAAAEALATAGREPRLAATLVDRSRRLEAKADALTLKARGICGRLTRPEGTRRLVDEVENAMDALDECAFLISLSAEAGSRLTALEPLADIVVQALGDMVRAAEATACLPGGRRVDAVAALQAIDATTQAERDADAAERAAIAELMRAPCEDARGLVLGIEIARMLESSTDNLAHAALALRERVLQELAA